MICKNIDDVIAWVTDGTKPTQVSVGDDLLHLLNSNTMIDDAREFLRFELSLRLQDSLLIRAGSDVAQMAHLSRSDDTLVVSGTSIAGALRARTQMIANTVNPHEAAYLIDDLFGKHGKDGETSQLSASRVSVQEHHIMRNGEVLKRDDKKDFCSRSCQD